MLKYVLAALAAFFVPAAAGAKTLTLNPARTVEIIDVVDASVIPLAQTLEHLSIESKAPIYVLLNSPGGNTLPGYTFADAMVAAHERGAKIVCVTGVLAASMAFNLFAYCDERYALAHAKLLFHPVRISAGEGLSLAEMIVLTPQLQRLETRNKEELGEMMGVSPVWFDQHYYAETLWEAEDLVDQSPNDWLTIVDDVKGTSNLFTIQKPRPMFQMFSGQVDNRDVWPSTPRFMNWGMP